MNQALLYRSSIYLDTTGSQSIGQTLHGYKFRSESWGGNDKYYLSWSWVHDRSVSLSTSKSKSKWMNKSITTYGSRVRGWSFSRSKSGTNSL